MNHSKPPIIDPRSSCHLACPYLSLERRGDVVRNENEEPLVDPVEMYAREVRKVEPLTEHEEADLFRQLGGSANWNQDKEMIARRLIENRLALVLSIAKRYAHSGVPMVDLIQEGNLGLFAALKTFADNPSGSFGEYAATYIRDAIVKVLPKTT